MLCLRSEGGMGLNLAFNFKVNNFVIAEGFEFWSIPGHFMEKEGN